MPGQQRNSKREIHRNLVAWSTDAVNRLQADAWRNRVAVAEVAHSLLEMTPADKALADWVTADREQRAPGGGTIRRRDRERLTMGRSGDTRELEKAVGDRYRLAQANRFIRYCREQGVRAHEVMDGTVVLDLTPIQDANSRIIPEAVDYDAVRARVTGRRS